MVYFSVALHGGWTSGKFTDMGVVKNLRDCVNHCCNDTSCDLAMVLSRKCFTVHCYSLADCQTIPDGHAQIAYVTREGIDGIGKIKIPLYYIDGQLYGLIGLIYSSRGHVYQYFNSNSIVPTNALIR